MRWEEALEGYWLAKERNFSQYTVREYGITFRRFGEWIKNGHVEKVTKRQVDGFLAYLGDELELAPKTVLNAWIALSSFWTWAHEEEGLQAPHIIRQVERPKVKTRTLQPFSEDEVRRLLAALNKMNAWDNQRQCHTEGRRPTMVRDRAIVLALLDTGMRISELCDLRREDYDRATGRLIIEHGKGDKQRVVFLGQAAQRAVWSYLRQRGNVAADAPLFIASRSGDAFVSGSVRRVLQRAGDRAGVAGATPHRFRHTYAINFLRNGGNVLELQALLGHSSMEMVRRYARVAELDLAAAQRRASPADKWKL